MHKRLEEIIKKTKEDLIKRKKEKPLDIKMREEKFDRKFYSAILNPRFGKAGIIAEVKLASPGEGDLGSRNDIRSRIRQYEQSGVDAISVVTERHFFKGDPEMVGIIKKVTSLPILQKDFIVDEYQIYEAKKIKADAILLIAALLPEPDLVSLITLAKKLKIEPVVEVNNPGDLKKALNTTAKIIAVNARDLNTFKVDIDKACKLLKQIPKHFIRLGFSGIRSRVEVEKYRQAGAKAVLVGTALMRTKNIDKFIKELKYVS